MYGFGESIILSWTGIFDFPNSVHFLYRGAISLADSRMMLCLKRFGVDFMITWHFHRCVFMEDFNASKIKSLATVHVPIK